MTQCQLRPFWSWIETVTQNDVALTQGCQSAHLDSEERPQMGGKRRQSLSGHSGHREGPGCAASQGHSAKTVLVRWQLLPHGTHSRSAPVQTEHKRGTSSPARGSHMVAGGGGSQQVYPRKAPSLPVLAAPSLPLRVGGTRLLSLAPLGGTADTPRWVSRAPPAGAWWPSLGVHPAWEATTESGRGGMLRREHLELG